MKDKEIYWVICKNCKGEGKKAKSIRKKERLNYHKAVDLFEKSNGKGTAPVRPKNQLQNCKIVNITTKAGQIRI